jgi:tetratricopeptide (TPR) repeat protein
VLYGQGRDEDAIANLVEVVAADSTYTEAHLLLCHLYRLTGDNARARLHGETALRLCKELGNQVGEADALVVLGEVDRAESKYDEARQRAQLALELAQKLDNEFDVIRSTVLLGTIAFSEGDLGEVRRIFEGLLVTSRETQNNRSVVNALMNIGVTYVHEGNIPKALEYIEKSMDQERVFGEYRDYPALRQRAQALTNLGSVLIEYGPDAQRGFQYAQEALSIFERMGSVPWRSLNQMNIGLYHMNSGNFDRGLEDLRASRALAETIGHKGRIAQCTYNIGRCHFFRNSYQQCLEALQDALAQFQELESPFNEAMAQILLGWCYRRLGQPAEARPLLEQSVRVSQEKQYGGLFPDAFTALGELELDAGDIEAARAYFQQSNESGPSESSIEALSNLGLLEAREDHQRGIAHCVAAVVQARELQHLHTLSRALINLAKAHLIRKNHAEAIEVVEEVCLLEQPVIGSELRAQACVIMARALEGLARLEEASMFHRQAQEALLNLQLALKPDYRESFLSRPDIQAISR